MLNSPSLGNFASSFHGMIRHERNRSADSPYMMNTQNSIPNHAQKRVESNMHSPQNIQNQRTVLTLNIGSPQQKQTNFNINQQYTSRSQPPLPINRGFN